MHSEPERVDPRRKRTIDALLSAAEALMAQRSWDELTVHDIADRAGVAVSSIYNHFGSKDCLQAALVERALDVDEAFMDAAYVPGRAPADQIRAAAQAYLRFAVQHPDFFRMLAFPAPPGRFPAARDLTDRIAQRVARQNARLAAALEAGMEEGTVRPVDPDATATFLWAAMNGLIALLWREDALRVGAEELEAMLDAAAEHMAVGLLSDAARPWRPARDPGGGCPGMA